MRRCTQEKCTSTGEYILCTRGGGTFKSVKVVVCFDYIRLIRKASSALLQTYGVNVFIISRSNSYHGDSDFNAILTPLTFLAAFFNSALNPFMYAFLSRNFRKGTSEVWWMFRLWLVRRFGKNANEQYGGGAGATQQHQLNLLHVQHLHAQQHTNQNAQNVSTRLSEF